MWSFTFPSVFIWIGLHRSFGEPFLQGSWVAEGLHWLGSMSPSMHSWATSKLETLAWKQSDNALTVQMTRALGMRWHGSSVEAGDGPSILPIQHLEESKAVSSHFSTKGSYEAAKTSWITQPIRAPWLTFVCSLLTIHPASTAAHQQLSTSETGQSSCKPDLQMWYIGLEIWRPETRQKAALKQANQLALVG